MSRNPLFLRKENFFVFFKKVLAFSFFLCYYMQALERARYALVAQLDRVTDYESVGRGFESLPAYHLRMESLIQWFHTEFFFYV